jgi:hypothetical protein
MATDFSEDLDVLDAEHKPEDVKWSDKAPDGLYQARLDICRVGRSKNQRLQTFMRFEIVHGEHEGRVLDKYAGMETAENLDFLTRDIWTINGEKINFKWKEVDEIYKKLLDTVVEVKAVTDPDVLIQNVFVQKRVTKIEGAKTDRKEHIGKDKPKADPDKKLPF